MRLESKGRDGGPHTGSWLTGGRKGRAPLCEALAEHVERGGASFHLPAHKGGRWAETDLLKLIGRRAFEADLTELPGLDDLHAPGSVIAEAQRLAAETFGADESFFLVNGSTAGLQALILATSVPGGTVILPRNTHRAVVGALILAGARPAWLQPRVDPSSGVIHGPSAGAYSRAIAENPGASCLVVLHPTYEGLVGDLGAIVGEAHAAGVTVVADEAHGAHFAFHPGLPRPALAQGADGSVQSLHKTLGSLTGSSMLHVRGKRIDYARLRASLALLQTSSPSYLLMSSLDSARRRAARGAEPRLQRMLEAIPALVGRINALPGLRCWGDELVGLPGVVGRDPLRLLLDGRGIGLPGPALAAELRQEGVWTEMSTSAFVLALVSLADTGDSLRRLGRAVERVWVRVARRGPTAGLARPGGRGAAQTSTARGMEPLLPVPLPPALLPPREAFFSPARPRPLEEAVGRLSAATVSISPPGTPALCPGEVITPAIAGFLHQSLGSGATVTGLLQAEPPVLATVDGEVP